MKINASRIIVVIGFILLFGCNSKPEVERELKDDDGFRWYRTKLTEINDGKSTSYYGAESFDGTTLIPLERKFTRVYYHSSTELFEVNRNWAAGLYDKFGRVIISPNQGYDRIDFIPINNNAVKVFKNDIVGVCDMNGNEIVSTDLGYTSIETERVGGYPFESSFRYLKVKKNGYEGVLDMNGKCIISTDRRYESIGIWNYGFYVTRNNFSGFCDTNANEIIAPDKYDEVEFIDYDYYFKVEKNGYKGACDLNGKEIVPPIYDYVDYNDYDCEFTCDSEVREGDQWRTKTKIIKFDTKKVIPKSSSSSNSSTITPTPTPTPQSQPRQPQPFQVWKQCYSCQGSGQCHTCLGLGHSLTNPDIRCIICNGTGRCTQCGGQGGHNEVEYH